MTEKIRFLEGLDEVPLDELLGRFGNRDQCSVVTDSRGGRWGVFWDSPGNEPPFVITFFTDERWYRDEGNYYTFPDITKQQLLEEIERQRFHCQPAEEEEGRT